MNSVAGWTEELAKATLRLSQVSQKAYSEAGVRTTVVIVTQDVRGNGVANVYVNGALQEVPMEMMMFAKEAYDKTRTFALAVNKGGITAEVRG